METAEHEASYAQNRTVKAEAIAKREKDTLDTVLSQEPGTGLDDAAEFSLANRQKILDVSADSTSELDQVDISELL